MRKTLKGGITIEKLIVVAQLLGVDTRDLNAHVDYPEGGVRMLADIFEDQRLRQVLTDPDVIEKCETILNIRQ